MHKARTNSRKTPALTYWIAAPVVVAALAFGWWTISPLFVNSSVDEAFPTAVTSSAAQPSVAAPTVQYSVPTSVPLATAAPASTAAPAPTAAQPTAPAAPTAVSSTAAAATALPAEPIALSTGNFTFIDRLHWAEGVATIYQLGDGSRVLRLENFTAQNGPDLYVGLSGHGMPRSSAEAHDAGYVELERLKANQGNQNYLIPAELDLAGFKSVVIYCKAFSVVFSTAELTASQG